MRYSVRHKTVYHYSEAVSLSHSQGYFEPREDERQNCLSTYLVIEPEPAVLKRRRDFFGNRVTFFAVQEPHQELSVVSRFEVEVNPPKPVNLSNSPPWESLPSYLQRPDHQANLPFALATFAPESGLPVRDYTLESFPSGRPLLEGAMDLVQRVYRDFTFDAEATAVTTPVDEVFEQRRGVCQDFAHLTVAGLRSLGLATRYVSGYLLTEPPPGQPKLEGADASHAWISVFCPHHGWVDFDPTNNLIVGDQHVMLAWGRFYDDVCPLRGVVMGGGQQSVQVAVDVVPL